jgi:hypothetical protein
MKKIIIFILILAAPAFAETDKVQAERMKKEASLLRSAVEEAINTSITGQRGITEGPKVVYLDGYGVVASVEVQLEPVWNPFSGQKTTEEVKATVAQRSKDLQAKLEALLKQRVNGMESVVPGEYVTIVVHIFNYPIVVPDLPGQLIFSARKPEPAAANGEPAAKLPEPTVTLKAY